ncbi:bifunctional serine/threonine-protein kinase/ABC transporter substrate-binding protein [Nodularia spumigena CS-588/02]|nr:bifunctional serine/threonine-protein kinase/ABC transporter substrate-binding protein [Nodularia spumigena]MDB9362206.1 bifunctional serine/threonine-protein kinase/ABC transporter substrate-binding protein [Nodularia spumigena CS-588/02]MDB9363198.1 bifunctional serine/threonine-protein kinase/ABC transporter substrate-binding protein [Nodularia spumigena CS-588/02A10]
MNSDTSQKFDVFCTRPGCNHPQNFISQKDIDSPDIRKKICCHNCGMPLILQGRFLPKRLLVSEQEQGGIGITFLGEDLDFEKELRVIKQLHPRQTLSSTLMQRVEESFKREAKILSKLNYQQIPRAWAFFVVEADSSKYPPKFFYLVQDYIEGENLSQILKKQRKFSEAEVLDILKEILKILTYIHNYDHKLKTIHRDIKPANIMRRQSDGQLYLIDFGAVKQVTEGLPGLSAETTSMMFTPAFAPPEQHDQAEVSPASDLYALATTCVSLLTGCKNPNQLLFNSNWKEHANVSNHNFANVIDSMLKYEKGDRPQSAQDVLDALAEKQPNPLQPLLDWLKKFPQQRRWIILASLALLGVAIAIILNFIETTSSEPHLAQYFSRGENALINENPATSRIPQCTDAYELKLKGIDAFREASSLDSVAGFRQAENYFKEATDKFREGAVQTADSENKCQVDPETLIYYYNAKAAQTRYARNLPTIAVVIPSVPEFRGTALEILRGVAQVQSIQSTAASPVFQIKIVKDNSNDQDKFTEIVKKLSNKNDNIPGELEYFKNSQILGVIGHSTSDDTWKAGAIYQEQQLVLISPTSTAVRKPNPDNQYVFRTAANDHIAATNLAKYYLNNHQPQETILIVYASESEYSQSLKQEFYRTLVRKSTPTKETWREDYCDLSTQTNSKDCIQKATAANVKTLMLAPSRNHLETALEITKKAKDNAKSENRDLQLLAGDVLYGKETFEKLGNLANGMVVAVSSHADIANSDFTQKAIELWSTAKVSWRTLTSYDAAQSFFQALTELSPDGRINPTREEVYQKLKTISAPGATQVSVEFDTYGDRKEAIGVGILAQASSSDGSSDEYRFTYLETPERK